MQMQIHTFDLPLAHPFTISRGTQTTQPTLVVELIDDEGRRGYGEATTNSYYGATLENMAAALENVRAEVEMYGGDDPACFWRELDELLRTPHRFAQCALDMAAWDLWGKRQGQPLHTLWGFDTSNMVPTSYTIGLDTIETMIAKLQEKPGWPVYKVKLGAGRDLEIMQALRGVTNSPFTVDANNGWSFQQLTELAGPLAELGVRVIEQPLAPAELQKLGGVLSRVGGAGQPLVVADESCVHESDVEACAEAGYGGINIKLVKCGGLTPARRMIENARRLGLGVMIGCMTESSVGISAAAQLLPLVDFADLDGALLLAQDIAQGVTFPRGDCRFAAAAGTGVSLL